ncbi:FMN-dependent NADH-azoreductase [Granulicella arctica]|uniref:FMN-dependent NADH-azoreductase n=1 Tax=Granulicella arctica TaxID=940613 RepID=UPI0021DF609C|nr:NAD(P)H-dependent oxidoreductase [Granulicella arctica]
MPTLLHIDSSPLGEASVSRHLTSEFVQGWKTANPQGQVITRDVSSTVILPVNAAWVGAVYTPAEALTPEQKQITALSDTLIGELQTADEYVFGVPMHNFSIPSTLKLWIDQIARVNKTFSYATGVPKGLLTGKKATILIAAGGVYDAGTAMASYNFADPYLRTVLGFLGVTDVTVLAAGGVSAIMQGKVDRETFLTPHVTAIRSSFKAA